MLECEGAQKTPYLYEKSKKIFMTKYYDKTCANGSPQGLGAWTPSLREIVGSWSPAL